MDRIVIEAEESRSTNAPQQSREPREHRDQKRFRFPLVRLILAGVLMGALLSTGGCKQQQQMQQQLEAMDTKFAESQKRITALEGEIKKTSFEIQQMKTLITKLGNVVVELQKLEEERRNAAEAAKAAAAAKGAKKKPAAKTKRKH